VSITAEVIDGTLKSDGTLELDHKPALGPGRVRVALQPAQPTPRGRSLARTVEEIRQEQQARGFQGRTVEEIEADLSAGEDDYEQRMQDLRTPASSDERAGDV
jgi:hypothetical protein